MTSFVERIRRQFTKLGRRLDLSGCGLTADSLRILMHHRRKEFDGLSALLLCDNQIADPCILVQLIDLTAPSLRDLSVSGNPVRWPDGDAVSAEDLEPKVPQILRERLSAGLNRRTQQIVLDKLHIAILHEINTATSGNNRVFAATDLLATLQVDYGGDWRDLDPKTLKIAVGKLRPQYVVVQQVGKKKHHSLTEDGKRLLKENPLKS